MVLLKTRYVISRIIFMQLFMPHLCKCSFPETLAHEHTNLHILSTLTSLFTRSEWETLGWSEAVNRNSTTEPHYSAISASWSMNFYALLLKSSSQLASLLHLPKEFSVSSLFQTFLNINYLWLFYWCVINYYSKTKLYCSNHTKA